MRGIVALLAVGCGTLVTIGPASAEPANVVAYAGRPFGVGKITVAPPRHLDDLAINREAFELKEVNGRVFYPVFTTGPVLRFVRNLLGGSAYRRGDPIQIWFLFRGGQALDLNLGSVSNRPFRITPRNNPSAHAREMQRWWQAYTQNSRQRVKSGDYPPLIETYLTNMLAKRLNLPPVDVVPFPRVGSQRNSLTQFVGGESWHLRTLEQMMRGKGICRGEATEPVPDAIRWAEFEGDLGDGLGDVKIEPIASQVPRDCFYIRFGNFANFRWFRRLLDENAGDLSRLVMLRGFDAGLNDLMETQLVVKENALAALFAGQVISDVAFIGRDLRMRNGAAMGILFETRLPLLEQDMIRQRQEALDRFSDQGAREEIIELAGHKASFLSTPDNLLRSFYVKRGRYHLVTNSRWIAERFHEVGDSQESLAETTEFRAIRAEHPVTNGDLAWIYLSSHFQQSLFEPEYQIEMQRRSVALSEMETRIMAERAARVEGLEAASVPQLIKAGFLPVGYGDRVDGSQAERVGDQWIDTVRGRRGQFTPIPDLKMERVTPGEAAWFRGVAGEMKIAWRRLDPIMLGIRRTAIEDDPAREKLELDVRMLPFQRHRFSPWIDFLGPPTKLTMRPAKDDILFAEIALRPISVQSDGPTQLLFLGVQDATPYTRLADNEMLRGLQMLRQVPGYVGAWPHPGWLDRLPWVRRARPDWDGMVQLASGLWRFQSPYGVSLVAFHREVLEYAWPQLQPVETETAAQVRFHVGDLSSSALRAWTHDLAYQRARKMSEGNVRLFHALSQQFDVPRSEARDVARELLNVRLTCPMGGNYVLATAPGGLEYWVSDAWLSPPADYVTPVLTWFRGAKGQAVVEGDKLLIQAEIEMQKNFGNGAE